MSIWQDMSKELCRPVCDALLRRKIRRYLRAGEACGFLPAQLAIETSAVCNARCIMCPQHQMTRLRGFMLQEVHRLVIDKVAAWAPAITTISHAGMGEPLLDRGLADKVRYEKKAFPKARVIVFTNASLLNEARARRLLEAGLDDISISLNAFRPETYRAVMSLPYEETLKNVLRLLELRSEMNASLKVAVSLIPTDRHLREEIAEFLRFWTGKADAVVVPTWISWGEHFRHEPTPAHWPCRYIWQVLMVDWSGIAKMCCEDYDTRFPLGDLTRESPDEIFNSARLLKQRTEQTAGRFEWPEICRNCIEAQEVARDFWRTDSPLCGSDRRQTDKDK
jgi:pyruvate-formate lyase-activating enzyme